MSSTTTTAPPLRKSSLPSKYIIHEQIGKGSFSSIYRIVDSKNGNAEFALKKIKKKRIRKIEQQIRLECTLMKNCTHKNILPCFEKYEDSSYIYLILEYCQQGDLSTLLKHTLLNERDVHKYFSELVSALKYLYENKIVHRDLKPKNILISNDNTLKLADFGFAKNICENDLSTTICGSPLYMAPELLSNHKYSSIADLWSVGIVLYEMISGKPPYFAQTIDDLKLQIQHESQFDLIDSLDVSDLCKQLLYQLLDVNQSSRMSWDDFFSHPWVIQKFEDGNNCENNGTGDDHGIEDRECEEHTENTDLHNTDGNDQNKENRRNTQTNINKRPRELDKQFTLQTYIKESYLRENDDQNNEVTFEDIISEDERYVIVNQPSNEYAIIRRLRSLSSSLIHFFLD